MWQIWQMSKEWRKPPSEILGISDKLVGYYFNQAVMVWGRTIEKAIHEATEDCKTSSEREFKAARTLDYWLAEVGDEIDASKFKSPI